MEITQAMMEERAPVLKVLVDTTPMAGMIREKVKQNLLAEEVARQERETHDGALQQA